MWRWWYCWNGINTRNQGFRQFSGRQPHELVIRNRNEIKLGMKMIWSFSDRVLPFSQSKYEDYLNDVEKTH